MSLHFKSCRLKRRLFEAGMDQRDSITLRKTVKIHTNKLQKAPNIHPLDFSVSARADSLLFIFVRSQRCSGRKVKTWKIGYGPGILSARTPHLPLRRHTTGTRPKIQAQQPSVHFLYTAFVLHLRRICVLWINARERDQVTFQETLERFVLS